MNRAPIPDTRATPAEIAEGAAYIRWRDNPNPGTEKAWQAAWFAAEGWNWTPTQCACCGVHRSYLCTGDACRNCGHKQN